MNVSRVFIRRPVATTLLTIGLALAGIVAFRLLPVSSLPRIDFPTILVSARLPGADPETMATSVAAPLEKKLGHIAGVTEMTSSSNRGATRIIVQFDLDRNIDGAARDVQGAINAALGDLPPDLYGNPIYFKVNPSEAPIMVLALTSDSLDRPRMYDAASTILQQKLSQVEGVGQVFVGGGSLPAVRVEMNPMVMNKYGISLRDMRGVIVSNNANRPKGQLMDDEKTWEIQTNDRLHKAWDYRNLIVSYRAGAALRLTDVAYVHDSQEDSRTAGIADGKPAVSILIFRRPDANVIETVDRVRALLPQLTAVMPGGIELNVLQDRTPSIRGSLREVERALAVSLLLVILVVFLFLRDVRSTLIPGAAVTVSIVGTFGIMYLMGFSLNNLSLMALTISTGFVVDDAIVVVENITRYREKGAAALEAALKGSREIAFTVISMTISLVAVFIPILLMRGVVGRLFREFAITLSAAILISMVLSLTTTPMMCATLLKSKTAPGAPPERRRFYDAVGRVFDRMHALYEASLRRALRRPRAMLTLTLSMVVLSSALYIFIPKGFFPEQDTGRIGAIIRGDQTTSFQTMRAKMAIITEIVRKDPDVVSVTAYTGGGTGTNIAVMNIALKPPESRKSSVQDVIARLRKLYMVPGAPSYLQAVQDLRIGGRSSGALYQFTLQGDDLAELNEWARKLRNHMYTMKELVDVNSDLQDKGLEVSVVVDRDAAARFGIRQSLIDEALYDAFGQRQISITYTLLNQYRVIMEVEPRFLQHPETLQSVYVTSETGRAVPLSAFTRLEQKSSPLTVHHQSQFPAVTLSFNLARGVTLGEAVAAVEEAARRMNMPASIRGSFQGTAKAFKESLSNQPLLILAALVAVYIVLGILYESYIHPITILSTLPSAGVGALLSLFLLGMELSLIAVIGIILLIGLVKKNGIMMVDFALDAERKEGKTPMEAIYQACLLRFRPIMMTTMAAMLGALPLALGAGVGSEIRRPLGISIIGGLIVSQMLTLYTTPVIYLYLDRFRVRHEKRRRVRK
jgi:multidrug efflux pump